MRSVECKLSHEWLMNLLKFNVSFVQSLYQNWLRQVYRNYKSRRGYTQHVGLASASPRQNTITNASLHLHVPDSIQNALHMFVCISLSYACLILRYFRVIIVWTPTCITITLVCIQKLHHAFTRSPQMAIQYFPYKIHITHFTKHCTVALRDIFSLDPIY